MGQTKLTVSGDIFDNIVFSKGDVSLNIAICGCPR